MVERTADAPRPPLWRSVWAVAWVTTAVALPLAVVVLSRQVSDVEPWLVALVALGIAVAESLTLQFEFRKQSFAWTASELALVVALVTVGGAWAAAARAAAVGAVLVIQGFPRAKVVFNVATAVLEVVVACIVLELVPRGDLDDPVT